MFRKISMLMAIILGVSALEVRAEQILMWEQENEDGFGDVCGGFDVWLVNGMEESEALNTADRFISRADKKN